MRSAPAISMLAAALAMAATPVAAVELPRVAPQAIGASNVQPALGIGEGDEAAQYRRYRYRRHRNRGVDAGDIITGAVILGGIYAVVSAISGDDRQDRRNRDTLSNDDFDRAVDRCVDQIERRARIGSVDNVGRTRDGYLVSGTLFDGQSFDCRVADNGRVLDVDYGDALGGRYDGRYDSRYDDRRSGGGGVIYRSGGSADDDVYVSGESYGEPQYSDDVYARARANTYSSYSGPDRDRDVRPAYPGGPLPGEEGYDDDGYDRGDYRDYGDAPDGGDDYRGTPY